MASGLAEGALVSPHRIMTSDDISRTLSMGQGCVVKVDEEDTKVTCGGNKERITEEGSIQN